MNVQEYISSGIVESYVLGLASPEEQQEFERLCGEYPELLKARTDFEIALEQQAFQHSVAPPASLKADITAALGQQNRGRVIPMERVPVAKTNWLKYAVAAAIVLLAGSVIWNVSLYNKNNALQTDYAQLKTSYDTTVAKLDNMDEMMNKIVLNPNIKTAAMKGMEAAPASSSTVYWDSTSKDVYLVITNLPTPPGDRQYQLWALLDGKPIDVGMIENEYLVGQKKLMLRMKNVNGAQAFAITLEKKGGNPTPEGQMYVLGKL